MAATAIVIVDAWLLPLRFLSVAKEERDRTDNDFVVDWVCAWEYTMFLAIDDDSDDDNDDNDGGIKGSFGFRCARDDRIELLLLALLAAAATIVGLVVVDFLRKHRRCCCCWCWC